MGAHTGSRISGNQSPESFNLDYITKYLNNGYRLAPACLRYFTINVSGTGAVTVTAQQNAFTKRYLNLVEFSIENNYIPNTQGYYTIVYEFFGALKRSVYNNEILIEPSKWVSDDKIYKVYSVQMAGPSHTFNVVNDFKENPAIQLIGDTFQIIS